MSKTIEQQEVGTPKDYTQQIMLALRNLEHGMSLFQGQWIIEAGEEDNIFELIEHAISKYGEERDRIAEERGIAKGREEERERIVVHIQRKGYNRQFAEDFINPN